MLRVISLICGCRLLCGAWAQKKIEMESETFYGCERKKRGRAKGEGANLRQSGLKSVANALAAHRSPHATCNLRFAFMLLLLLLLSAYVCASVLAAACGPQMVLTALQRSRKYEIRLADIRTTANI